MLDGKWWNSKRRVPEKYLVLHRNYDVSGSRLPTSVPGEQAKLSRKKHYFLGEIACQLNPKLIC